MTRTCGKIFLLIYMLEISQDASFLKFFFLIVGKLWDLKSRKSEGRFKSKIYNFWDQKGGKFLIYTVNKIKTCLKCNKNELIFFIQ